jgi:hypothetical protein
MGSKRAPLAGWTIEARSNGALRCRAFGWLVYVARDDEQATALASKPGRGGEQRLVFSRRELAGAALRGLSEARMRDWLRDLLLVKASIPGARVEMARELTEKQRA